MFLLFRNMASLRSHRILCPGFHSHDLCEHFSRPISSCLNYNMDVKRTKCENTFLIASKSRVFKHNSRLHVDTDHHSSNHHYSSCTAVSTKTNSIRCNSNSGHKSSDQWCYILQQRYSRLFPIGWHYLSTTSHLFTQPPVDTYTQAVEAPLPSTISTSPLWFPDFASIHLAETGISSLHLITGLQWWSTVVVTAFVLRLVLMIPLTIYCEHNEAKLARLDPEIKEMSRNLRRDMKMSAHQLGWEEQRQKREYKKKWKQQSRELYIRDNCHPWKSTVLRWVQLPVWISVSLGLRNLSNRAVYPELENHSELTGMMEQGIAWFPDLTLADSTWILPLMVGAVTLFNIEVHHLHATNLSRSRKNMTYFFRSFAIYLLFVSAHQPTVMVLYWICSGLAAATQNVLLLYSPFRRLVRLPQTPSESKEPLRTLLLKAKTKYFKSKH